MDPVNPESLDVVAVGVAICAKFAQPPPEQRSTLYPVTPTLSVDAVQTRLICVADAAVAVKFVGAVGGVVSGAEGADEPLEHPLITKMHEAASKAKQMCLCSTRFTNPLFISVSD